MATLTDIARDMHREATTRAKGLAQRDLPRGLKLQLVVAGGLHVLSVRRSGVAPSETELAICRQAFSVPADTPPEISPTEVTYRWPA